MRLHIIVSAMLAAALLSGCLSIQPPTGYAKVENKAGFLEKMVSTEGAVFTLNCHVNPDPEHGTLGYWGKATKNQLTLGRGYEFKEEGDFSSARGKGKWMLFAAKHKGVDCLYMVGLVVSGSTIYVMESAGKAKEITADLEKIKKAFATIK